jgi:hypothetical protein
LSVAVVVACLGVAGAAAAGPEPPPAGPCRVGLVLSGGGALGIAHVGVIRVLEELHVPVDCIAGTSMGAIVGGLHAAGYSPAELEALSALAGMKVPGPTILTIFSRTVARAFAGSSCAASGAAAGLRVGEGTER